MCGRFVLIASEQQIIEHFNLRRLANYQPDYNIPPGQKILNIVQLEDGSNKAAYLHWGLIPSWSKDRGVGNRMINARAETVAEKPAFRSAYRKRRCLIPATGFYEWQRTESGKQPYHIHYPDNHLFAFVGIWEHWENESETIYSCAIITTGAGTEIASIHDRMPVIVRTEHYADWLDKKTEAVDVLSFDQSEAYRDMLLTPVSNRVNNPMHNDADCLS